MRFLLNHPHFSSSICLQCLYWLRLKPCCWGLLETVRSGLHTPIWSSLFETSRCIICMCHIYTMCIVTSTLLVAKTKSRSVLTGPCITTGIVRVTKELKGNSAYAMFDCSIVQSQTSQTDKQGEASPGEEQKSREWKGAHEDSCLLQLHRWCSRWDGRGRWIKSQEYDSKREKWRQSMFLTAYIRSSWLENFQRKYLNIYCSAARWTHSLHLQLVSKKNGSGAITEILIPLEKHNAEGRKA